MPSNYGLAANPTSVPAGGTSQITVSMTLDPGSAEVPVTVTLQRDGGAVASTHLTIPGAGGEAFPAIKLAGEPSQVGDLVLVTDVGALSRTGDPATFTLQL